MKEFSKNKRGISLIVLVITIIVMIILAAAIILSLNSSDIIGKANEAKTSSDAANKKAAASVLLAEYELALVNGETEKTASQYVKDGLEAQGIDASDIAIAEDGEILVGLSKVAVAFVEAGVKIGDTVTGYTLSTATTATSYTTSGNENTCDLDEYTEIGPQSTTISRNDENNNITWQYFGLDETGNALIVGSVSADSPKMTLGGKGGYLNGPKELNDACKAMYSSNMGIARSIDLDDVIRVLGHTGVKGEYSLPSGDIVKTSEAKSINQIAKEIEFDLDELLGETPDGEYIGTYKSDLYYIPEVYEVSEYKNLIFITHQYWLSSAGALVTFSSNDAKFAVRWVGKTAVGYTDMFLSYGESGSYYWAIRPVVELSDTVKIDSYNAETGIVTIK